MKLFFTKRLLNKINDIERQTNNKFNKDKILILLKNICYGTNKNKPKDHNGWIPLSSKLMQSTTIGRDYKFYLDLLIEHNIIEKKNYNTSNNKCNRYRILEKYKDDQEVIEYCITDKDVLKRLQPRVMKEVVKKYKYLWDFYISEDLQLDQKEAFKEIDKLEVNTIEKLRMKNIVTNFNQGYRWFSRNGRTDKRLHTALTNMDKMLRSFLRYKGGKLYNLDISNSQLFFLLKLLNSNNQINQTEYKKFKELVVSGNFYKKLGECLINETKTQNGAYEKRKFKNQQLQSDFYTLEDSRKLMKEIVFEVLFSSNRSQKSEKKWFKNQFPTIMKYLEEIKENKTNELALKLQNIESNAVIDKVTKAIKSKNIPLFTIHDSIMTNEENLENVKKIMEETLTAIVGDTPHIKEE